MEKWADVVYGWPLTCQTNSSEMITSGRVSDRTKNGQNVDLCGVKQGLSCACSNFAGFYEIVQKDETTTMKAVLSRVCQLEDTYWRDTFHDCLIA